MAVQITFFSMIIKKTTLAEKYPGGVAQYREDCPNKTYHEDDYLTCMAYMSEQDIYEYRDEVIDKAPSLTLCTEDEPNNDIMLYHYGMGFFPWYKNDWLQQFMDGNNGLIYLAGTEPGANILHWDYNKKHENQVTLKGD